MTIKTADWWPAEAGVLPFAVPTTWGERRTGSGIAVIVTSGTSAFAADGETTIAGAARNTRKSRARARTSAPLGKRQVAGKPTQRRGNISAPYFRYPRAQRAR